jgi:hypothetical protein
VNAFALSGALTTMCWLATGPNIMGLLDYGLKPSKLSQNEPFFFKKRKSLFIFPFFVTVLRFELRACLSHTHSPTFSLYKLIISNILLQLRKTD